MFKMSHEHEVVGRRARRALIVKDLAGRVALPKRGRVDLSRGRTTVLNWWY